MSTRPRPGVEDQAAPELAELGRAARHDLSELLGASSLHAELFARLTEGTLDPKAQRHLEAMRMSLRHLQTLLDGLGEYAWAAAEEVALGEVDLFQLAEELADGMRPGVERRGGSITIDRLPTVLADEARLRVVVGHLLRNAITHAGRDDVNIELRAARDADGWRIAVSDDGQGIPVRDREDVLRPFTRRGRTTQGEERTAGIGLSVCAAAVRRHGGRLWIEDGDPGAIVWFSLPDHGRPLRQVR